MLFERYIKPLSSKSLSIPFYVTVAICLGWQEMIYQQIEERAKLGRQLAKEAIALAIQGRWKEAVAVNKSIIEKFPTDIGAYNRLGRALTELGEFIQAKEAYSKALELAPNNVIAVKNLARLASLAELKTTLDTEPHKVAPELFITERGKSGVVNLCNLATGEVLARMATGDQVHLRIEEQRLLVENKYNEYLGEVKSEYGLRLIKLIRGGNRYAAAILSVGKDGVRVIIREEYQHPSQVGRPSFPAKAAKHLPLHAKESLLRHNVIGEEGEAVEEVEYAEEETGYSEAMGEISLHGFSILGETDKRRIEE